MAFYPDVHPGERARRTAAEENAIRHLLNAGDGFSDRSAGLGKSRSICVSIYNATDEEIPAGFAVRIAQNAATEPFPVRKVESGYTGFYGVLKTPLAPYAVGSMVVSGVAILNQAVDKAHAVPSVDGWVGTDGGDGLLVLNPSTTERAIVLIGAAGNSSGSDFEDFRKTLTNFCYLEGNQIVVNPGRVGLGGAEGSFWSHEESRFDLSQNMRILAWATSTESNKISYGIGGQVPTSSGRTAARLIFAVSWDMYNRRYVPTRYHIGGDIIIGGYMGLSIWKK